MKAARLQDIFGRDNLFVELQDHGIPEQHRTNPQLVEIAKRIGAPLLATNDSHYTHRHDAEGHDALLCVQTGALIERARALQVPGRRPLPEVGRRRCATCSATWRWPATTRCGSPSGPTSTIECSASPSCRASRCPRASRPTPTTCATSPWRGPGSGGATDLPDSAVDRLAYELKVIDDMGFSAYFLITWDLIKHARDVDIRVGPGRGSAAGCAVAYCLRITDLDPIRYDLLFERFLNPQPRVDARHRHGLRLPLPRRDDPLRGRALRARPRGPDRHLLHHQGPGRGARRGPGAGPALRRGRQGGQGHAAAGHGARHAALRLPGGAREVRRRLPAGGRAAGHVRGRPRGGPGRRRGQEPRGPAPPGRHPRRRGGDHRRAPHRVPAHPAQARAGPDPRGGAGRHPVRDGQRRGPGPAQDGLPGPAQPRRHHRRPGPDQGLPGHRRRHRRPAPRRRGHLRDAPPGRLHRRVPDGGRRPAPAAAPAGPHHLRGRVPPSWPSTGRGPWG